MSAAGPCCRLCGARLVRPVVDLGPIPLANAFIPAEGLNDAETFYPLRAWICDACFLVQAPTAVRPADLFSHYLYFSSVSQSWLRHAEAYAAMAMARFDIDTGKKVVEIASNDGYLLQFFVERGIPALGVEPAANVAEVAVARGIPTHVAFFGAETARRLVESGHAADLVPANNVLAHVPDPVDFLTGVRLLLKPEGVATFEFPHLLPTIVETQFDQICLEHASYLSFAVVRQALRQCGLRAFDVEALPTHGGSLRVFACHDVAAHEETPAVEAMIRQEDEAGLRSSATYDAFRARVTSIKYDTLEFLIRASRENKLVCGYGAAGKGTTFVNYCGFGPDLVRAIADRNPRKQNTWLPGRHIPVVSPEAMLEMKPDYVLILPWNLREEIARELEAIRRWGGKFVTAIPELTVF